MIKSVKRIIRQSQPYFLWYNWISKHRQQAALRQWEKQQRPSPPPHVIKQSALRQYAAKYQLKILVETGTYYGDMVAAMLGLFDRIYSIELSQELHRMARVRFRNHNNIDLIQGDSATELSQIVGTLDKPTLFWLDGHYSAGVTARGQKDTPIYEELNQIFSFRDLRHVILIDDARCFGVDPAYPTIDELRNFIFSKRDNVEFAVEVDIIRITPT